MITEIPETEILAEKVKTIENDNELKELIEDWYEKTRTQGMKLGAKMICYAGIDIINKHINAQVKPSLRDYKRAVSELTKLFSTPVENKTEQNNLGEDDG